MNVLWVAQDNKKNGSFRQTKAEVLCTISCVLFVKHYFPNFKTNLFVDNHTFKYYEQFGMLEIFDNIDNTLLNQDLGINSEIYWAAGKLFAQKSFKGPTLVFDLDFRFYSDLEKLGVFNSDISCLWMEDIQNDFYLSPELAMSYTNLDWKINWDTFAYNTSFLYLKNDEFRNHYCSMAIDYMKSNYNILSNEITKIEKSKFMMFVEQYMLRQLGKIHNQKTNLLIDDFWLMPKNDINLNSIGINMTNCGQYFYHFGEHKNQHMIKKDQFCLDEIERCHYITNNVIKNYEHLKIFNKIYKIDINERCFC